MKDAAPVAIYLKDYRAPEFLIPRTELKVDLYEHETLVTATLSIERNPDVVDQAGSLSLDGNQLELVSIQLDERDLDSDAYAAKPNSLTVFNPPRAFQLRIVTRINPQSNTSLEGLYKSANKFCTQCEAEGFRRITYFLDRPDVMSVFTTTVVADKTKYPVLLSNGNPTAKGELDDGRHWQTWHDPFKKPSYLFALVAGDLVALEDSFTTCSGREISLKLFVEPKDTGKCGHALLSLKNAMAWDEQVYGREYDLDLFMIVAVDDFNMGAMENKGLNLFNTSCVLADPQITTDAGFQRVEAVVAHEYFHNWSGNRVTCRDWFQLSLKEGFTVFRDSQFSADMGSPTVKRVEDVSMLRTLQFAEDAGPLAHPVQPPSYIEIANFYTLTIYEKGAEVVRMIYNLLGPSLFREGSDLYFERHDGQAVTIDEFVQAMADVSGKDFSQFKRWYTQAGTPVLQVSDEYDAEQQIYRLTVKQSCRATSEAKQKLPFHIPVAMGLIGSAGELALAPDEFHRVLELTDTEQEFEFSNIPEKPVPSLLRGFSAPVRLRYQYSQDDLVRLITLDTDGFNRWNSMQVLATNIINDLVDRYPNQKQVELNPAINTVFQQLLSSDDQDQAMIALALQLPSEAYLSEQAELIQVDAIHYSREQLQQQLAEANADLLLQCYRRLNTNPDYRADAEQIAQRSLKNIALHYLGLLHTDDSVKIAEQQFAEANNMTDRMAALRVMLASQALGAMDVAQQALDNFYQRFQHEALAIDQWLSAQAVVAKPDQLNKVKELMGHPCFALTNPNKVRALIGAFCNNNFVNFHRADGEGYQFLVEQIIALNQINPQIASRLLTPLTRWRKYDAERQSLMQAGLRRIAGESNLSKDVFEVVSKSLGSD